MTSRSRFYVETPRDPTQRHSMFVSHSELEQRQDLSSNSSSATLPSAAGSVDRLTGLEEKKSPGFFTLKPKSSFSLRPFFKSTSSLASLSPSKRRKAILERRDSYVQTEESRPVLGEVGVQTLNASTVDVPVQTCLEVWEEGDTYGHRRLAYTSARTSPFWSKPSVASSALSSPLISKYVPKDPLASPKLVKYAVPGDSQKTALCNPSAVSPIDVNSCQQVSPPLQNSSSSSNVPVKYFSVKELTAYPISLSDDTEYESVNKLPESTLGKFGPDLGFAPLISTSSRKDEKVFPQNETLILEECAALDKQNEVSDNSKHSLIHNVEHPVSVLKIERTDSPSKKAKTVHFDLPNSDFPKPVNQYSIKARNLDKDFEALLKDLNVWGDEDDNLKISFNVPHDKPHTPILLSPNLKSALDALKQDFLAPIPENLNECSEATIPENTVLSDTDKSVATIPSTETKDISPETIVPNKSLSRKLSEYENISKGEEIKNDISVTPTSLAVFTSTNSGSSIETDSLEGNVYDNVIKEENSVKTVPLPTLPSFFEPPSNPESVESVEIVEYSSESSITLPDIQSQSRMPLESDFDRNRLSRSSSRSSVRSNPRTGFDVFQEQASKFDSCENLDQLEEEIIRSLYSPVDEKFEDNIMNNIELPPSESFQNSGTAATHMRRVILDQLLSGKSVEDIVPNYPVYQRSSSTPETNSKYKPVKKYTAVLTKMEHDNSVNHPVQNFTTGDSHSDFNGSTVPKMEPKQNLNGNVSDASFANITKLESPKKTSVFIFPEDIHSNSESKKKSPFEMSTDLGKNASILEVRRSSWTPQTTVGAPTSSSPSMKRVESPGFRRRNTPDNKSGYCDFTNCLRPSKIQNSPFLAKINTRSMSPCNVSQLPPIQNYSTSNNTTANRKNSPTKQSEATGECDFASCLKPSQVQNSLFTAELSEITAGKSSNSLRSGSPIIVRSSSPFMTVKSSSVGLPANLQSVSTAEEMKDKGNDNSEEPIKHKSEFLITLKTSTKHSSDAEPKSEVPMDFKNEEETGIHLGNTDIPNPNSDHKPEVSSESETSESVPPPPPPPPLFYSEHKPILIAKENSGVNSTLESMIKDQKSNLTKVENPVDSRHNTSKTPVMAELEDRLLTPTKSETHLRNSGDKDNSLCSATSAEPLAVSNDKKSESNVNGSSHYATNGNKSQNGNIGILSEPREYSSSLPNSKKESNSQGTKLTFSPNTVITDEPPPLGAVLLDKKVTIEGDKVHTDRFFAIPMKEVLKEKTSTTKFIPAPPKYEGIGPTEDGIPIGLRNSVKKENMHNWYKTMFKSLHKADSPNDSQEYIIGYTSEPETSKKDIVVRKKSSTLDNRYKQDVNSNIKQNYTPSAKSSIEVYNVRPRLIEDYEPGYSSVTDDATIVSRRYLPAMNTPKTSYEFKNGYESDTSIIRKKDQPTLTSDQQKHWYRDIQKGGEIPQFGLGKQAPEKPKEPSIGPVPPPPLNYSGPSSQQAVRPLTLPADYSNQNGNGYCQQMNGIYEMQMRQAIHTEMHQRMSPSSNQLSPPIRSVVKSPCRSPDMKILAQALFDFKAESPKEIPLKKGDIVLILRQLDKNWYEGELKGVVGIFPISYVEIVPPEHASTPVKPRIEGLGKVLYDFVAQTPIELTVRKGDTISLIRRVDANWFEASFNNKKGIIPISYVQVLQEPIERNMSSPSEKSYSVTPVSESKEKLLKTSSISPSTFSPSTVSPLPVQINERRKFANKKGSNLIEPVMYRAIYSYSPQNSDELELQEGDTVYVVEMCDDGWYVGTSVRTGIFGIFPGNYVEKAC